MYSLFTALMMALKLNEINLIKEVLEKILPDHGKYFFT